MKFDTQVKTALKWLHQYLIFFAMIAFVTTCCMALFVSVFSGSMDLVLTEENVAVAAKLTFGNVMLLSLLFTGIDAIRRKLTVQRPARRIIQAAEKIMQGDFSVRIPEGRKFGSDDVFPQLEDCVNRMAQELQSVETLRTDFVANVSHEIKTPLAVIRNYGTLLQSPDLSDQQRMEYGKGVAEASRRMAEMMTNILKLNRLENQKIFPQTKEFDLGEQLCECLLQFETIWEEKNIEIETDIQDSVMVCADAELLTLVWNNLLSNAFKFTPDGGRVKLLLTTQGSYAVVRVEDTGCGMSAEVGAHIFEKFYQGDTSHASQGNGLGLALVKRVVDILRGEIGVESKLGAGTAFTVKIRRM